MPSINSVTLMGNLGADPEVLKSKNGNLYCKFPMATNYSRRNEEGTKEEITTWHNVKVFGKNAETCQTYLRKGRSAIVEGRIESRKYKKDDGSEGYWTEIVARGVTFVGGPRNTLADLITSEPANDVPF